MLKTTVLIFLSGIFFGSGPCVASCGPFLLSYVAGTKKGIFPALKDYILFSLARIIAYIILSVAVFFAGSFALEHFSGTYSKYIFISGGIFIVLTGIFMILGGKWGRFSIKDRDGSLNSYRILKRTVPEDTKKIEPSPFFIGLIIGFMPCGPLLALLSYVSLVSKIWAQSLLYGAAFGLGTFISPLLLLVVFSGMLGNWMQEKKYYRIFSAICGLIIIFFGVQLIRQGRFS